MSAKWRDARCRRIGASLLRSCASPSRALAAQDAARSSRMSMSVEPLLDSLRKIVADVGDRAAHRAEHAGIGRHEHRADADLADQRGAVQRSGAAEGDQGEIARIEALLDRDQPDAPGHALVDDGEDRLGGRPRRPGRAARRARRPRGARPRGRARSRSPCRRSGCRRSMRPSTTIRVGDGRLGAAAADSRPGPGPAPALRGPTCENAAAIDATRCCRRRRRWCARRSSAGAAGRGNRDWSFSAIARLAVDDDRDVEAGAAHVAGDDAGRSRPARRARAAAMTPAAGPERTMCAGATGRAARAAPGRRSTA